MSRMVNWIGSVWSLRTGKLVIGRVRRFEGDAVILAVVGLGFSPPPGVELLPADADGVPLVRVALVTLLGSWKRMGATPAEATPVSEMVIA